MQPLLLAAIAVAATWDSWRWTIIRLSSAPEEGLSLLLTLALLIALSLPRYLQRSALAPIHPGPVAAILALHALLDLAAAPAILRSAFATTLLAYLLYRAAHDARPPPAFWGLIALSMPILPSLQFVLGYPLRLVSASLTVALLNLQGVPITRDGTYVSIAGETVQFDAPCSGVAMLWALVLLTLMAAYITRRPVVKLSVALALAVAVAIGANALRVSSLLFVGVTLGANEPPWLHEAVGLAAFALSAFALTAFLRGPWFMTPRAVHI